MANLTLSEKYAIAAVLGLLLITLINSAVLMLAISAVGLLAGLWVVRQGEVRRVAFGALAGFAIAAVFAIVALTGA